MQKDIDPMYIWSVLRSPAVAAEWLSHTTGFGRHYVDWELIKNQRIPFLPFHKQKHIGDIYRAMLQYERSIINKQNEAKKAMSVLGLDDIRAIERLQKAKPPR